MSIKSVMPSNHLILCHPLLFLPSIFPSIRGFFRESALHIGWPKYWSFGFSISPSNEYSGLISFRMDWLDLLAVQGTLKSLLQHLKSLLQFESINSSALCPLYCPTPTSVHDYWKDRNLDYMDCIYLTIQKLEYVDLICATFMVFTGNVWSYLTYTIIL